MNAQAKKNPLFQLLDCGQSCWMDNLTRGMIRSGELERRMEKQGLRGVTSNPNIFNKAISGSPDYDDQIQQLAARNLDMKTMYEELAITDVQDACDHLRPIYDSSEGVDGFVSLEVSPWLAHDSEGTMKETRHLSQRVNRPNLFIKIPGSPAGVPAIEQMLYEGININITLLFSVPSYEAVAEAYLRALERRIADDKAVNQISSVASFFLSRIDVLVDQLLFHRIGTNQSRLSERAKSLVGTVAIANAKLAYRSFKEIFSGDRWKALENKGARVQRPLWASTSTKNPDYSDVMYVEPLIGPDTVNTMPEETLDAFADHGRVVENSIERDLAAAHQTLADLEKVGIDFDCVTWQLLNEGVQKFIDPFQNLMATLQDKKAQAS